MNQISENTKIASMIDTAIQDELRYATDNITKEGWQFLEEDCSTLLTKEIAELELEEIDSLSKSEIADMLRKLISEYEQRNANIRYF